MPPDGFVLGFDTSAAHCAAALLRGDEVAAARHEDMQKGQAERLMPLLEEILEEAGIGWRDLSAIGVGIGPGNFTGIRIAVSAARGLALSLQIPAIGVSSFDAVAHGLPAPVLASVDGRRGTGYGQVTGGEPFMATAEALPPALQGSGIACAGALADPWAALTGGQPLRPVYPLPEAIARLARLRADHPAPRPAPLYLRPADAALPSDPPPLILP